ncbi:hypothetical protein AURANDRAFT_68481 [Aureococcus anophagefferens]|uniref:Tyr recombinase domain-containing protein n=1 Tax=Aureococcus anophagefferens TaxID=44056 RepID=F0YPT1_AURAN|nr:hypothetical protein AURANDRAFT_68481 [Aureococcus anophagefferens]EGB02877.1 hypothetical protein AURANDRAFT_68481 [Aureococcus anophagefferens]|eukprot:XP_009042423.1 hypothetical protein AURANDRAFT_68481 [Aureococcus anophagefferens]
MAMAGLKRRQKSPKRKHPVTVAHIKQIQLGLDTGLWDDLLLLTAVSFGFSFLLRACEYLSKDGVVHEDKVLRMEHLHIFQAGHKLGWEQIMAADELVIHIPGSKTDIYNDGYKLNIKLRAGDTPSDINPLCLLRQLYTMNPARFGANGSKRPVFCLACGRVLERSTVNTALKAAAVALGLDPADHATHSLRAGGATALYAIGWPPSKIQRRGRWLSDCWSHGRRGLQSGPLVPYLKKKKNYFPHYVAELDYTGRVVHQLVRENHLQLVEFPDFEAAVAALSQAVQNRAVETGVELSICDEERAPDQVVGDFRVNDKELSAPVTMAQVQSMLDTRDATNERDFETMLDKNNVTLTASITEIVKQQLTEALAAARERPPQAAAPAPKSV